MIYIYIAVLCIALSSYEALIIRNSSAFFVLIEINCVLCAICMLVNAYFIVRKREKNAAKRYVYISLLLISILIRNWSSMRQYDMRIQKFVNIDMPTYQKMVDKIIADKLIQETNIVNIKHVVSHSGGVCGRKHDDGSISIIFQGRGGSARLGYLYHTGNLLTSNPFAYDPKEYIRYITNGWYACEW